MEPGLSDGQYGRLLTLIDRLVAYEEQEARGEHEARAILKEIREEVQVLAGPGSHADDWLPHLYGSPGYVVDEGLARSTPCVGYRLDGGELVWSKGITGALDEKQRALYCGEMVWKEEPERLKQRVAVFKQAATVCRDRVAALEDPVERLVAYRQCMSEEARARGIDA